MAQEPRAEISQNLPPHLAGALQAAAAARAMAERIRNRDTSVKPAEDQPPAEKPQTQSWEPRPHRPSRKRPPRPSFAKTIEAAEVWRSSTLPDGELVPWHLTLRQEIDERSWPKRWVARVFRRRAGGLESEGAPPHVPGLRFVAPVAQAIRPSATVEPAPHSAANAGAPADLERPPAGERVALARRPSPQTFAAGLEKEPVARLPSLRARKFRWDELSHELPSRAEHEASRWRSASALAMNRRWGLAEIGAASYQGSTAGSAARSLLPVVAPDAVLTCATVVARLAEPEGEVKLPVLASSSVVVRRSNRGFARSKAEQKASTPDRSAAPAQRVNSDRARGAKRLLLISCGIFAGFALGIAASGSALLTGFNLGQIIVQLDELVPPRSATAPAASRSAADTKIARRSVSRDTGDSSSPTPGEGQLAVALAVTRSSPDNGAAGADGSKDASQAQSASDSASSANPEPAEPATGPADDRESTASGSAQATGLPPGGPSWAALYARGHRAQSEGDLVAATHWYQEAARLNPDHPAILYDLGYMLQVQGDIDGAIDKYRKVIKLDPNHAYAQYDLGFLLQKKGEKESAVDQYRKAAKLNPQNPYIYFDWARILEGDDDLAGARALYERAAKLAPQGRPGTDARRRLAALNARMSGL